MPSSLFASLDDRRDVAGDLFDPPDYSHHQAIFPKNSNKVAISITAPGGEVKSDINNNEPSKHFSGLQLLSLTKIGKNYVFVHCSMSVGSKG